jgi:hypothetical protein
MNTIPWAALAPVPPFADFIAPSAFFLPGFLFISLGAAIPATVLAGVLERAFVSRAGVKVNAIWYSLQANLVSAAAGVLCMPFALGLLDVFPPLWFLLAVTISIGSEGVYYEWCALEPGQKLRWRWIILANIFSSAVLFVPLPMLTYLSDRYTDSYCWWGLRFERYQLWILCPSVAASLAAFAWSFVVTGRAHRRWRAQRREFFAQPSINEETIPFPPSGRTAIDGSCPT